MKILSKLLVVIIVLLHTQLFSQQRSIGTLGQEISNAIKPEGAGSERSPYQVSNLANLKWLSENGNEWGNSKVLVHYVLTSNIDASESSRWNNGLGFNPIGNSRNSFFGVFNGNNFTISNLTVSSAETDNYGLFGFVDKSTIKNLKLTKVNIKNTQNLSNKNLPKIGLLVGSAKNSNFTNIHVNGMIKANVSYAGGIIGLADSCVLDGCVSEPDIDATVLRGVGGFIGGIYSSEIKKSTSKGKSKAASTNNGSSSIATEDLHVGGFIGYAKICKIEDCVSDGMIVEVGGNYDGKLLGVGGFIGGIYSSEIKTSKGKSNKSNVNRSNKNTAVTTDRLASKNKSNSFIFVGNFAGYMNDSNIDSSEDTGSEIVIDDSAGNILLGVGGFIGGIYSSEIKKSSSNGSKTNVKSVGNKDNHDAFVYSGQLVGFLKNSKVETSNAKNVSVDLSRISQEAILSSGNLIGTVNGIDQRFDEGRR